MEDNKKDMIDEVKSENSKDCTSPANSECSNTDKLDESVNQDNIQTEDLCSNVSDIENKSKDEQYLTELVNKSNFYLPERKELLEIVLQYNELFNTIKTLKKKLDFIQEEVLKASVLYDDFKRNFATIIDDSPWFEKLYYTLPIFDGYEEDDEWDNQWIEIVTAAIKEENRDNLRNFINKNFYSSVYTLPKEVYCYKADTEKIEGIHAEIKKIILLLASRIARYVKYIKDTSDQLRCSMHKAFATKPITISDFGEVQVVSEEKIKNDLEFILLIVSKEDATDEEKEKYDEIVNCYKLLNRVNEDVLSQQEKFIEFARNTYQDVLKFQNNLNSLSKQVYTSSLLDIYKLYGEVIISLNDVTNAQSLLSGSDEKSNVFAIRIASFIQEMQELIEKYLKESYNIRPLKEIQVGVNFNTLDINWYDSCGSEPAPNEDLVECISLISDIGFAKYNSDNEVEFVTKPARIFVYSKQIKADTSKL